jgi:Protein of unknown function (DUF3089)
MARKFLYTIAVLIFLAVSGRIGWELFAPQLMRIALVPKEEFKAPAAPAPSIYADTKMWIARPELANNPALWRPEGGVAEDADALNYAVFFIHPTSYLTRTHWNAPLDDAEANERAALFVRGQASVFNKSPNIWAPRYRQATFGAFLTDAPEGQKALQSAYGDVAAAFDEFLLRNPKGPIILAGHSQGSLHLTRLLKDRMTGPLVKRIVAAYVVGWPIGEASDLPALGLPACATPTQTGCILSWQSFAEPADYDQIMDAFVALPSLSGQSRAGDKLLCTNPVTGTPGAVAEAAANEGTLKNEPDFSSGSLVKGLVSARCDDTGFLLIGDGPELGPYVLPGNNYHVYDYSLFWRSIRSDVERRARAFRPS